MTAHILTPVQGESGPTMRCLNALPEREKQRHAKRFYGKKKRQLLQGHCPEFELLVEAQRDSLWHLYCMQTINNAGDAQGLAFFYSSLLRASDTPEELKDMLRAAWVPGVLVDPQACRVPLASRFRSCSPAPRTCCAKST
jgi:hypothetical protein